MINQGLIKNPIFSVWLNNDKRGGDGGEIVFGGMNNAHFAGPISCVNLFHFPPFFFNTDFLITNILFF